MHRKKHPLLPADYEDPAVALKEVTAAWETEGASGAVLVEGDEITGYLLGAPKGSSVWGPNVWVERAGHAVRDPEKIRDLYGDAATKWYEQGLTAHYALVPDDAEWSMPGSAWGSGLSMRTQYGPCRLRPYAAHPGLEVRRAGRGDIPVLAELDLVLPQHQGLSPVFSAGEVPTLEEALAEWEESVDDPDVCDVCCRAQQQGDRVSIGCSLEKSSAHSGLAQPDNAGFLAYAAVFPRARGMGAGRALGEAVLNWSAEAGYDCIATDWRVTNLLSSRAWPSLGFVQTFHRLHRMLGH